MAAAFYIRDFRADGTRERAVRSHDGALVVNKEDGSAIYLRACGIVGSECSRGFPSVFGLGCGGNYGRNEKDREQYAFHHI